MTMLRRFGASCRPVWAACCLGILILLAGTNLFASRVDVAARPSRPAPVPPVESPVRVEEPVVEVHDPVAGEIENFIPFIVPNDAPPENVM